MVVAVPLGVGAALYVSQYARPRVARDRQAGGRAAGGHPVGGAGLLRADGHGDAGSRTCSHLESRLNAARVGRRALVRGHPGDLHAVARRRCGAVPRSYVEASTALGAARWQTIVRVILPAASPGIAAGVALGLGRAVGETMIVLMASGNAAIVSASFADSTRTICGHHRRRAGRGRVRRGALHRAVLPGHAAVPGDVRHQHRGRLGDPAHEAQAGGRRRERARDDRDGRRGPRPRA